MKKNALRVMAAVLTLAMMLSLSGCGPFALMRAFLSADASSSTPSQTVFPDRESSSSEPDPTPTTAPPAAPPSEASSETVSKYKFASVQEYLEDPAIAAEIEAAIEAIDNDMLTMTIDATYDTLIYIYTYREGAIDDLDDDYARDTLAESLNADDQVSLINHLVSQLNDVIAADVKIQYVYCRSDGSEIYSQVFYGE